MIFSSFHEVELQKHLILALGTQFKKRLEIKPVSSMVRGGF